MEEMTGWGVEVGKVLTCLRTTFSFSSPSSSWYRVFVLVCWRRRVFEKVLEIKGYAFLLEELSWGQNVAHGVGVAMNVKGIGCSFGGFPTMCFLFIFIGIFRWLRVVGKNDKVPILKRSLSSSDWVELLHYLLCWCLTRVVNRTTLTRE